MEIQSRQCKTDFELCSRAAVQGRHYMEVSGQLHASAAVPLRQ